MPANERKIDFYHPPIGPAEKEAVQRVLDRGWLTTGPEAGLFEKEFRAFLGCRHVVATSSGTAALHLGLLAAGVGAGDEVITSPYTFVASAEAIEYCGARPVFADVLPDGYTIDPAAIEQNLTQKTKAILPVGIGGIPCRLKEILGLAAARKIPVIEDGAHTLGATVNNRPVGVLADATAFSFYSTKNLMMGEGGVIATSHDDWAKTMRILSRHGISQGTWDRHGSRSWAYDVTHRGYKYNISDVQAAIGRAQLARFAELQQEREQVARWYTEALDEIDGVRIPAPPDGATNAYHLMMIRLTAPVLIRRRDDLLRQLTEAGIGVSVHFIPLHLMTYFRERYRYREGDFPQAEAAFRATISLPFYPDLTGDDVQYVVEELRRLIDELR